MIGGGYSVYLSTLVDRMLQKDVTKRVSVDGILNDPFVKMRIQNTQLVTENSTLKREKEEEEMKREKEEEERMKREREEKIKREEA